MRNFEATAVTATPQVPTPQAPQTPTPAIVPSEDRPPVPGAVRWPGQRGLWFALDGNRLWSVARSYICCEVMHVEFTGIGDPFLEYSTAPDGPLHGYWFVPAEPPALR